jgi:hypothetical protein
MVIIYIISGHVKRNFYTDLLITRGGGGVVTISFERINIRCLHFIYFMAFAWKTHQRLIVEGWRSGNTPVVTKYFRVTQPSCGALLGCHHHQLLVIRCTRNRISRISLT